MLGKIFKFGINANEIAFYPYDVKLNSVLLSLARHSSSGRELENMLMEAAFINGCDGIPNNHVVFEISSENSDKLYISIDTDLINFGTIIKDRNKK